MSDTQAAYPQPVNSIANIKELDRASAEDIATIMQNAQAQDAVQMLQSLYEEISQRKKAANDSNGAILYKTPVVIADMPDGMRPESSAQSLQIAAGLIAETLRQQMDGGNQKSMNALKEHADKGGMSPEELRR